MSNAADRRREIEHELGALAHVTLLPPTYQDPGEYAAAMLVRSLISLREIARSEPLHHSDLQFAIDTVMNRAKLVEHTGPMGQIYHVRKEK